MLHAYGGHLVIVMHQMSPACLNGMTSAANYEIHAPAVCDIYSKALGVYGQTA